MTAIDTTQAAPRAAARPGIRRMLAPIARDIAIPMAVYFGLHWMGYSDFTALLGGAVASAAIVLIPAVRARRLDPIAAIVLIGFVIGLVGSLISGDPRIMIVRDSVGTAGLGLAFLISAVIGKPLTYAAMRKALAGAPERLAEIETSYRTEPSVRRTHRGIAMLWGAGLSGEAALRIVLAYQLPISTMAWLSSVLMVGTIAVLMVITARTVKHLRQRLAASATA
ncbi:VC0807 family protein [Nocardia acidivorans]|uniref:VC0807 family protein n=1 Tax=Nocardia acidivorans TaxID=404580 RepID=UPI0008316EC3|nr:VC0807 family protein [Nocardia acidivorans]